MTRIFTMIVAIFAVLPAGAQLPELPLPDRSASLTSLPHETGWIYLGQLTADQARWAGGGSYPEDFTGTFDLMDRAVNPRLPILPVTGEIIRLRTSSPVLILDFKTKGDERRLAPPEDAGVAAFTGVRLPKGQTVRVAAVWVSRVIGDGSDAFRFAYARVVPLRP